MSAFAETQLAAAIPVIVVRLLPKAPGFPDRLIGKEKTEQK